MVWIYGGGFRQGSNRDPEFNTSFMVETSLQIGHPVIVVSINYRLSGFGFLWSQELNETGATNLGLRDQWKALEWIQENIRGFGGDPGKVTIWGESAGAFSVDILISAFNGQNNDLFQRAILASGSWWLPSNYVPAAFQAVYDNITAATGCNESADSLQCLKARKSTIPYVLGPHSKQTNSFVRCSKRNTCRPDNTIIPDYRWGFSQHLAYRGFLQ
jgi:carboxylesterase type B